MTNREIIDALNALDMSTYPYDAVLRLISQFTPKVIRLTLPPVYAIERMRPDGNIMNRKDISYRPAEQNMKPQRATLPGQTAFYGTLCSFDEPLFNNRKIALTEASKLFREGIMAEGTEDYTISRWRTKVELKLAVFVHDEVYPNADENEILRQAKVFRQKNITFIDKPLQLDVYEKYVTEQFAKPVSNEWDYIITATIADRLLYASGLDGVLYPSVQCGGNFGMNVAIKPEAVEDKLLLEQVHELRYTQAKGEGHLRFTKHFVPGEMDSHGVRNWTYSDYNDSTPLVL